MAHMRCQKVQNVR